MTLNAVELIIALIGLSLTTVLFYRFPRLPEAVPDDGSFPTVSVVIPARNEQKNLSSLLKDLHAQSAVPFEIICVDDESSDSTAQIAELQGVRVLSLHDKPQGWIGKSWACQNGADAATGELLLFLDADVRLGNTGILRILQAYSDYKCTISVQPFHKTEKSYEQLSLLFNLIQIAANGTALPKPLDVGLYGPVILISKSDYDKVGGHESVRDNIVEDMALGARLKETGIPYTLFVGDEDVSFRMYGEGPKELLQGWAKNMAAGALKTPPRVFAMVFFWISSLISVPLHVIGFALSGNVTWMLIYLLLYFCWASVLWSLSKRIGRFRFATLLFYPILVAGFLAIFAVSMFKKAFGLKVVWKDRAI